MRYKIICLLGLALTSMFFVGCATPKGKPFHAVEPIPADKGVLYVYSAPISLMDGRLANPKSEVLINDNAVGCLRGETSYMAFLCQPGSLIVSCGWKTKLNSVTVNIESGSQSFVKVERNKDQWALVETHNIWPTLVPEQEALSRIQGLYLIESSHGLADKYSVTVTPGTDLSRFKRLYVVVDKESKDTAPFIVSGLTARGYTVRSGAAEDMPDDTECLVKSKEGWFWDLETYLLDLKVELLKPQTKAVYASAFARRAEPQGRRGPKVMVAEALNAIFNNGMPAGVESVH